VGAAVVLIVPVAWIMLAPLFGLRAEPGAARHEERVNARHPSISDYRGPAQAAPAPVAPVEARP
jgi:hypothetical protein